MKASEAQPLQHNELRDLQRLLQRWILCHYPVEGGGSEESDAIQTYQSVLYDLRDVHKRGRQYDPRLDEPEWFAERLADGDHEQELRETWG